MGHRVLEEENETSRLLCSICIGIGVKPWYELTAPADLLSSGQFKHQPHITSLTVQEEFNTLNELTAHRSTDKHRIAWINRKYRTARKTFVGSRNLVLLDAICKNDQVPFSVSQDTSTIEVIVGETDVSFQIKITNENQRSQLYMGRVEVINKMALIENCISLAITDSKKLMNDGNKILKLNSGSNYTFDCTIRPSLFTRRIRIGLINEFSKVEDRDDVFYCGWDLVLIPEHLTVSRDFGNYIPGVPVASEGDDLVKALPLRQYHVPADFQREAFNNERNGIYSFCNPPIRPDVSAATYANFFRILLWLEELQLNNDIQYYSKKAVYLTDVSRGLWPNDKKYHELQIEGLAESRPCVMERDQVFVRVSKSTKKNASTIDSFQYYQGIVHKVLESSVYLAFDEQFSDVYTNLKTFDVEFVINRYTLKVSHRALTLSREQNLENFLFPTPPDFTWRQLPEITPYNATITNNKEQIQAIKHIVARSSCPAPYLVFGPPGTGKTVTIVEAIQQVLYHDQTTHVLACAPSNSAADIIADRLLETLDETHVFRMYAMSRASVRRARSPKLERASNINEVSGKVFYPEKAFFEKKRVIVCTFIMAARIASACFSEGHFTHVILDEAGHAEETDALVAIANILSPDGQLVLAGDPHQLGPVVRNVQAIAGKHIFPKTGLDTSFLERLMSLDMYKADRSGNYNPRLVSKLLNNYRSHGSIIKIPDQLFYESQLRVKADPRVVNSLCDLSFLPKKNFPVIFHAVLGEDKQKSNSPSHYNPREVEVVLQYVEKLLNPRVAKDKKAKICPKDIGIITPYKLQVHEIRNKLSRRYPSQDRDQLKVGSVEDFQGEERRIIIISTVRASKDHLTKDELFKLGFLRNPKRFNVAITRAQALLIVIGCPVVLQLDKNWKSLIRYIGEEGGYVGQTVPEPLEDIDSIIHNAENIDLRPLAMNISYRQIIEEPAFNGY